VIGQRGFQKGNVHFRVSERKGGSGGGGVVCRQGKRPILIALNRQRLGGKTTFKENRNTNLRVLDVVNERPGPGMTRRETMLRKREIAELR